MAAYKTLQILYLYYMNKTKNSIQTKNAFFFSHDSNARNDEKLVKLRMYHSAQGYGIYFMIIEMMMESTSYQLSTDYAPLAFQLHVDKEQVRAVVEDFDLFQFSDDGEIFFSASLLKRVAPLEDIREQRRQAGIRSGEARRAKKAAKEKEASQEQEIEQVSNTRSVFVAPKQTEERRVEQSREKESRVEQSRAETTFAKVESPSIPQGGNTLRDENNISSNGYSKNELNIANAISIHSYTQQREVQTQTEKGARAGREPTCNLSSLREKIPDVPTYKLLGKSAKETKYTYF